MMRIPSIDYRAHPAYRYAPTIRGRYEAMRIFLPMFFGALRQRMRVRPNICTDGCELGRNGVVAYRIAPETIATLRGYAEPYISQILKNKDEKGVSIFKEKVVQVPARKSPEFFQAVAGLLDGLGIIRRAEHYRGYPLRLTNLAVQVGDPEDSDWRNHFKDVGVADPPTAYYHIDGSLGHMKALIYLTEVGEENGPFCYVPGSNTVLGVWEHAIRYANDKAKTDSCDPERRKIFAALPRAFQKKSEFGNDMREGFNALLKNEYKILSARDGNLFLFDNNILHRGGMVAQGRRIILQINFRPLNDGYRKGSDFQM
ncbi:MAG: phytanoyl-CoA dioxygenase family protein [bacterium]|nr:phytanoyl-CoA dioxygenase family protein [bacterium]MDZ4299524.1 hypothetical protein [Candidatus Sungbacteria bacterium]